MSTSESSDDSPIRPKKIFSETPAMAIKRFSIVDSSEEEEELKNQFNDSSLLNALETNPHNNHNHQNSSTDLKGSSELLKDEHCASYYDEGDKVVQKKEETSSSSSSSVAMDLSFLRKGKEDPKQPSEDSVPSIHQEDSSPVQPPSPPKEAEQIRKEEQKDQQSVKESTTKSSTEHSDKHTTSVPLRDVASTAPPATEGRRPPVTMSPKDITTSHSSPPRPDALTPKWTNGMFKNKKGDYVRAYVPPPGGDIYQRGMKMMKRREEKMKEARDAQVREEVEALSFKPEITRKATTLHHDPVWEKNNEETERIRKCIMLFEMASNEEERFSPRISRRSRAIVGQKRSESGNRCVASERLYRDFFFRENKKQDAIEGESGAVRRSPEEIESHIAALQAYAKEREEHIESIRQQYLAEVQAKPTLHVNTKQVVKRLTDFVPAKPTSRKPVFEIELPSFQPHLSDSVTTHVHNARVKGYIRWFDCFADKSGELGVLQLCEHKGENEAAAAWIRRALFQKDIERTSWTAKDYLSVVMAFEHHHDGEAIWKWKPKEDPKSDAEDTYRPKISAISELLVRQNAQERREGPIHDRLYVSAREKQLLEKNKELEARQKELEEEERQQQKRLRLLEWIDKKRAEAREREAAEEEEEGTELKEVSSASAVTEEKVQETPFTANRTLALDLEKANKENSIKSSVKRSTPVTPAHLTPKSSSVKKKSTPSLKERSPSLSKAALSNQKRTPSTSSCTPMQVVDLLTVPLAVDLAKEEGASISPLTSVSRGSDSAALNKAAVVLTHSAQKEEGGASGERRPLSIDGEGSTEKTDTSAGDCFFQPVRYCRTTLPRKPSKVQMSHKGTYMKETLFLEKKCKKRLDRLDKDVYSL